MLRPEEITVLFERKKIQLSMETFSLSLFVLVLFSGRKASSQEMAKRQMATSNSWFISYQRGDLSGEKIFSPKALKTVLNLSPFGPA